MGNAISEIRNPYRSEIMVARKKQTQSSPAVAPLKPQGVGKKRTPQSAYDPAAGCELYEPEKIVAQPYRSWIARSRGWAEGSFDSRFRRCPDADKIGHTTLGVRAEVHR